MDAAAVSTIQVKIPDASHLCTLSITDAHHDFNILSDGQPGPDLIKGMMPGGESPGGCIETIKDEDILASTLVGLRRDETKTYKPFIPIDDSNISNRYLREYDIYNIKSNDELRGLFGAREINVVPGSVYFIVDTKSGGFSDFLKGGELINPGGDLKKFYYVQNRQTLYDPADKISPLTSSGSNIFKSVNTGFAWEDTSPGMTQNYTYPVFGLKTDINESIFCRNLMVQTLKSSSLDSYKSQKSTVFMKEGVNVHIFNKEIAQKSTGSLLGKIQSIFNNNYKDIKEIKELFGDESIVKDNITQAHHYVAKRLGDQGQALSTCQPKMKLIYEKITQVRGPTGVKNIVNYIKLESNGNHCFVTYDRPAMVAAIMYGAPMVLFNYMNPTVTGDYAYTLFVNKKLNDAKVRLKKLTETYNKMIAKHVNTDENIASITTAESEYKLKYDNIRTLLQTQNRDNFSNTRDKSIYINFLKGYLLPARYIQLLSSINIGSYERARLKLIENKDRLTEEELRTSGPITGTLYTKIQEMEQYINDIINFEKITEINNSFLKAIPDAVDSIDFSVKNDPILKEFLPYINLTDITVANAPRAMRGLESKVDVCVGTKILIYILIQLRSFEGAYTDIKTKIEGEIMTNLTGEEQNVAVFQKKFNEIFTYVESLDKPEISPYNIIIEKINKNQEKIEEFLANPPADATPEIIDDTISRIITPFAEELINNVLNPSGLGTSILYPTVGGGNPTYTLSNYYDDDRYLRSVLILYAAIKQNQFPVKYLGFPEKSDPEIELYNSLVDSPISVLSYLFGFTVDEITGKTVKSKVSKKEDFYKNKSICYYDFIEFQISPYPELQAIYILLNKEYYDDKYRIPIPIPYKFLKHILMRKRRMMKYEIDQSKYLKSSPYINIAWYESYKLLRGLKKLRDTKMNTSHSTFPKMDMQQYEFKENGNQGMDDWMKRQLQQMPKEVFAGFGGRRYRKTKRRIPRPAPKKQTRRYKNPQRKSRKQSRTRK